MSFHYDADGNRVQMSTYSNGFAGPVAETTSYVGSYAEYQHSTLNGSTTLTSYYFAGGQPGGAVAAS